MTLRILIGICALATANWLPNAVPNAWAETPLPYHSKDKTVGTVNCASSTCHGSVKSWKDSNVLQNEYITWSRVDKHARAYNIVLNERSRRIA